MLLDLSVLLYDIHSHFYTFPFFAKDLKDSLTAVYLVETGGFIAVKGSTIIVKHAERKLFCIHDLSGMIYCKSEHFTSFARTSLGRLDNHESEPYRLMHIVSITQYKVSYGLVLFTDSRYWKKKCLFYRTLNTSLSYPPEVSENDRICQRTKAGTLFHF